MVYLIPIVVIVTVFAFTAIVHWTDSQRKEREAFYRAETLRRITETSGEGAKLAADLLREQAYQQRVKARESMKLGGMINVAVSVVLVIILRAMVHNPAYLCGLIPGFIGVVLLVYVYFMAPSIE
jgi:ferric-dicitrate binding protein FerR (iron transport regulator)